jgi:hypothetical protein
MTKAGNGCGIDYKLEVTKMKRSIVATILTAVLMLTAIFPALAAHHWRISRDDAREVLRRTNVVIREAQRVARHHHNRAGLGKAIGQQRYAIRLYQQHQFQDAVYPSLRARRLATQVIRSCHGRVPHESQFTSAELRYRSDSPDDDDLDVRIRGVIVDDDSAISISIEFNL